MTSVIEKVKIAFLAFLVKLSFVAMLFMCILTVSKI